MNNSNKLTINIGADIEFFLRRRIDNSLVEASEVLRIPEGKDKIECKFGHIHVDGIAAEICPNQSTKANVFTNNVLGLITKLESICGDDYFVSRESSVSFDEDFYSTLSPETRVLGCNVDYDAYTLEPNKRPDDRLERFAGGHIHVSWESPTLPKSFDVTNKVHLKTCSTFVQTLDLTLGLYSVLWEKDFKNRRSMYGKSGSFRPKSYGVEYRVLDNSWVFNTNSIMFVFETVMTSFNIAYNFNSGSKPIKKLYLDKVRDIINGNVDLDVELLKSVHEVLDSYSYGGSILTRNTNNFETIMGIYHTDDFNLLSSVKSLIYDKEFMDSLDESMKISENAIVSEGELYQLEESEETFSSEYVPPPTQRSYPGVGVAQGLSDAQSASLRELSRRLLSRNEISEVWYNTPEPVTRRIYGDIDTEWFTNPVHGNVVR